MGLTHCQQIIFRTYAKTTDLLGAGAQGLLPLASIYHLGLSPRNEETLEPRCYLNKLLEQFAPGTRVLIPEPMIATSGSMLMAMAELTKRGIDPAQVRLVSMVVAPPALQKISSVYPAMQIYTATINEALNEHGFIVLGLGDAGDRPFGT